MRTTILISYLLTQILFTRFLDDAPCALCGGFFGGHLYQAVVSSARRRELVSRRVGRHFAAYERSMGTDRPALVIVPYRGKQEGTHGNGGASRLSSTRIV